MFARFILCLIILWLTHSAIPERAIGAASTTRINVVRQHAVYAAQVISATATVNGSKVTVSYIFGDHALSTSVPPVDLVPNPVSAGNTRYDLICAKVETRTISLIQGIPRLLDWPEFKPRQCGALEVPLYSVRVSSNNKTVAVPVWYLKNGIHKELVAARLADINRLRLALRKTFSKAGMGRPITVAAMGDSITAMQAGPPSNTVPNGPLRDRPEYFADRLQPDTIATLPLFDNGDGVGTVHVRISKAWSVVGALHDLNGSRVVYNNFAIAGTSASGGLNQGDDPALRSAVWRSHPDLLVLAYGMNERGSPTTEGALRSIISQAFARGIEVLVLGCPRPAATNLNMEALRYTWRSSKRAAEYRDPTTGMFAAYYDPSRVAEDRYIGAYGLASADFSDVNGINHPGIYEHTVDRAEIRKMMLNAGARSVRKLTKKGAH